MSAPFQTPIIPPPVRERPRGGLCSVLLLVAGVAVALGLVGVAAVVGFGYAGLERQPDEARAVAAEAAETFAASQADAEARREAAGEALPEDFDFERLLLQVHEHRQRKLMDLFDVIFWQPGGLSDRQVFVFAQVALEEDAWPEAIDVRRLDRTGLIGAAAAHFEADERWQTVRTAIEHGLAWRLVDPLEPEPDDIELDCTAGATDMALGFGLTALAALERGDRAAAWAGIDLLESFSQQLMREPGICTHRTAVTIREFATRLLMAIVDHGPLDATEQDRHARHAEARADTAAMRRAISWDAALAPQRRADAGGFFPRLARTVLFDGHWRSQRALLAALDDAPHLHADDLIEQYRDIPFHADEARERFPSALRLYRSHWHARFAWELAPLAAAIKRWHDQHGEYPETLEPLLDNGSITAIPEDPVWGEPIRYARVHGGFALYSLEVETFSWLRERDWTRDSLTDWTVSWGIGWQTLWRAGG